METPTMQSRIKGSIFGVAVVDALGGPVEFQPRGSFPPVTHFMHNDNFNVPPGTWTDDTSMTLCLAQSIIASRGNFVPQAAICNYIKWYENGYLSATDECFDIGAGTRQALMIWKRYFEKTPHIREDDPIGHEGGQHEIDKALKRGMFCGNGSLMRVAPIALVYFQDMDRALSTATLSSNATHPYPTCAECCMVYTRLIVCAMNGSSKEDLAKEVTSTAFIDVQVKQRLDHYSSITDWEKTDEDDIKSSGYVVSTLEAALWAFFTTSTFESGAFKVVNLGNDADTVGAVYGGLAGAYYGIEEIPSEWIAGLQKKEVVEEIASGLCSLKRPDVQKSHSIPLTPAVASLIQSCVDSAQTVLRILRVIGDEDLLEAFLPFQLEDAFSSAFLLHVIRVVAPSLVHDDSWCENIQCILDKMISKGSSSVAPLRKLELTQLEQLLAPLTPVYDPLTIPLQADDDRPGYSTDRVAGLATASEEPGWDFFNTDMTVGISPTQLLDLAAQLDVDGRG
ncbi:ADP-ribosylglycohydrolase family protein [Aspergillus thermomutatus]|uniref:ADP-ribosylhydrolase ARH3 n=1 Tax=Aspergillus thermomutatus TaxID=41047 RepID=A0A397G2I2_ASPTH|nr:uncharacterized protein CDV56_100163 [Aspergillus thermomutatus]RHZ43053.1 hypothetical protein CDV56_100163 [Aspergillus thermomutatus]